MKSFAEGTDGLEKWMRKTFIRKFFLFNLRPRGDWLIIAGKSGLHKVKYTTFLNLGCGEK